MFAEIAPRYDLLNHLLSFGTDVYWRDRTVKSSEVLGTGPVLDVCCGTGDLTLAFWRHRRNSFPIVGVDFCREMVQLAKRKADRRHAQIHFIEADGLHLPFPDDTFAVVAVAFGLRNMADTGRGLSEMVRVCRPGGEVMVLEFTLPTLFPINVIFRAYFRFLLPIIGQALAPNRQEAYNYLPASVHEFPQGEALLAEMAKAGLKDLVLRPFSFGIATLYKGSK
ncbi:MAG TPA: bifunctional demethylmenaquinone methyltransferase/2-methoxy-6-polyprenyl-1,4-benzoquinol methylase UbiE [Thermogutta sp.]|nr:bifunctional demethylmenaquinone methyltransferase/2-methoxy-6-polyprenyl-1,4-benzoquinol methylase UbiE [Thermogutta sp.]